MTSASMLTSSRSWPRACSKALVSRRRAAAGISWRYSSRAGKFGVWAELLDELGLRGDEQVLDIGRGAVLLLAAGRLPRGRAVGADIWRPQDQSGNSRAAAERNAALEGVADRVELAHADARNLPFAPDTFDIVVSNLTIHNIPGDDGRNRALREAVRVLRPDGQLRIIDFLAGRYAGPLLDAGCQDVTVRRLGWRMRFGLPVSATALVCARKPAS